MRLIPILLSLTICCHLGWTQTTLSGTVTDKETGEAIFGANIFIENSTVGAVSDPDGKYEIKNIRGTFQRVVISHLSYENKTIPLNGRAKIDFKLKPKINQVQGVEIEQKKDRKWARLYKQFEEAFIGKTQNAAMVTVKNPWVMELSKDKAGVLNAHSLDLLEIENAAIGYKIQFLIESFTLTGPEVRYSGKPLFTPMEPSSPEQQEAWEKQRKATYLGSKQHFMHALVNGKLESEGFDLFSAVYDQKGGIFRTIDKVNPEEIYKKNILAFDEFLKVIYDREKPERAFVRAYSSSTTIEQLGYDRKQEQGAIRLENRTDSKSQVSYLFTRTSRGITVTDQGILKNPEYMLEYGYWSWERVAELLPYEYHLDFIEPDANPDEETPQKSIADTPKGPMKNGFDLSNATVPVDDLVVAVPKRDGIPAINNPKFQAAESVDWLGSDSRVIGLNFNGVIKAYPIEILNRHEVINDVFGGKAAAITYCPLCGSGMAYDASSTNGESMKFGISGLLYNSNVLLYDQSTGSLWSQIQSRAISGQRSGQRLKVLPLDHMKWSEWKAKYPQSQVMTRETGFNFDYAEQTYVGYDQTDEVPFPVKHKSTSLGTKELVIGLSINDVQKAYPLELLKKNKEPLADELGGKKVFIDYFPDSNTAVVKDEQGNVLPSLRLYWFAWYAFHPNTAVYN